MSSSNINEHYKINGIIENKIINEDDESLLNMKKEEVSLNGKYEEEPKMDLTENKIDIEDKNTNMNEFTNIFSNITLCLMGMSSVLMYNCVLNTTPHIHELLNKNIVVSSTFFLYFSILVIVSLLSSLFIEVKTRTYDVCFILSFILQMIYPFTIKYFYDKTVFFYVLVGLIGATCSMMKTMIFSISSIVVNNSKVICLSYGLTGVYSLFITSTFFYFVIKINKDVQKLMLSLFITSAINCVFILVSFVCYTILKRTNNFKEKFKIYIEERKNNKNSSDDSYKYYESVTEKKTPNISYPVNINSIIYETKTDNTESKYSLTKNDSNSVDIKSSSNNTNNMTNNEIEDNKILQEFNSKNKKYNDLLLNDTETLSLTDSKKEEKKNDQNQNDQNQNDKNNKNKFFLFNINKKNIINQAKIKAFLYKKSFIFLFCTFYNIFLKILIFPVVCPEMWTNNVDERYILIGIVQFADCISRIFPSFAGTFPIFKIFLLTQKKVLIYSLLRTILSVIGLIIPLTQDTFINNFLFKCALIFLNIYLNGWFVIMSFINVPEILKPINSMSNVAIVSSFGSTLLRVGLLTGYGCSTLYKHFISKM
ncbi:nucleoside transporter 2 [Plasmodium gaboni]|uniref:Nucleoside transporter 2 n=1 Tax=Plasmodium gaboni TaxID=647221 RepID=A0A151LNR7_9APIC|nr:nucleoside transporter 2 [Plasmodium gaboni]KYO00835.1 nucleoside transporter 2 [Plasmodium gaboni]